jgi:putative phage-type endonuclease
MTHLAIVPDPATHERAGYIGGSTVAAILGISPWRSPVEAWLAITGRARDDRGTAATRRGLRAEGYILDWYAEQTGARLHRNQFCRHPLFPHHAGHLDAIEPAADDKQPPQRVIEAKTARLADKAKWGAPLTDEVPLYYLTQCLWYHHVVQPVEGSEIAVAFSLDDVARYIIPRNADMEGVIAERVESWWQRHVIDDVPPPLFAPGDAAALYRTDSGTRRMATPEEWRNLRDLVDARRELDAAQARVEAYEDRVKTDMADAAALLDPATGDAVVSWRNATRTTLDIDRLRREQPALAKTYSRETISRTFRLHIKE